MKPTVAKQKFPPGWSEKRIRALIAHYDNQTDEEGAAEIESAPEASGETWLSVPNELVGTFVRLIEEYQQSGRMLDRGTRRRRSKGK